MFIESIQPFNQPSSVERVTRLLAVICCTLASACSGDGASNSEPPPPTVPARCAQPGTPQTPVRAGESRDERRSAGEQMLRLDESVVPTLFFSDGQGNGVREDTPDDTVVYRALPGQPDIAQLIDTDGEPLTWGEVRQARGQAEVRCEAEGSRIVIDASDLRPNGVYTGWLAFFHEPGFAALGPSSLLAISPIGPTDGSQSVFVASASGHGELEAMTPKAQATVPFLGEVSIPQCLLDVFEVHVVLAYHPDGNTCGDNPCENDAFVEHLAWMIQEGQAYRAETDPMSTPAASAGEAPGVCL